MLPTILLATLLLTTPVTIPEPITLVEAPVITEYAEMPLYSTSSVKRYEDFRCINNKNSTAYKLTRSADICSDGTLELDGYKLVAIGQGYGTAGDKLRVTFSDGRQLGIMIGDSKQDIHTQNGSGYVGMDGHVLECIVDTNRLPKMARTMGDCDYVDIFHGEIVKIEKEK